jgi:ankyrin repeat protein
MTPLHKAIQANDINIVEALVRSGGHRYLEIQDDNGATALHHAVTLDWDEVSEPIALYLRSMGARLDACDNKKRTPLMWAAEKGDPRFVLLLLERLDNRDARDADGKTAQDLAEIGGHDDAVSCIKFYNT